MFCKARFVRCIQIFISQIYGHSNRQHLSITDSRLTLAADSTHAYTALISHICFLFSYKFLLVKFCCGRTFQLPLRVGLHSCAGVKSNISRCWVFLFFFFLHALYCICSSVWLCVHRTAVWPRTKAATSNIAIHIHNRMQCFLKPINLWFLFLL